MFPVKKSLFLSLLFLLACLHQAIGQGAKFEVNSDIGCNPFTVVVTDLSGAPDTVAVNYDWGDGSPLDSTEYHTYSQPGTYTIIQTVANANPRQDTAIVEVINQYPPEFHLFNCKGTFGSVIVQDTLYEAFEIDWGDGNSEIAPAYALVTHNYGVISSFNVTVKGLINGSQTATDSSNINCHSTTKRLNMIIDIQPAVLNEVQVVETDNTSGSISINYTLQPDNNYLIELKSQNQPGYTIVDTINQVLNPDNYLIRNLNTADNYYCISVTAFDPCDGDRRQSNIGCSINLTSTAQNQQNLVEWFTSSSDFLNYTVYKDGAVASTITNQGQTQFTDDQVVCGINYNYQLSMMENNGFLSISDTSSVTAISTDIPEPIINISATVSGQDIIISWEEPQNYVATGYVISRSKDSNNYEVLDTLTTNSYTDPNLFTQSTQYFYKIEYFDACGNLSEESIVASPVLLVSESDKTLYWTNYEGWSNGISGYLLEKYDENGNLIETIDLGISTSYREDPVSNPYQFISYKIIAIPNDFTNGNVESNLLKVIYRSKVAFPNAFSPDGDGLNDIFNFESRFIKAVRMKIFNRWGELVYQTTEVDRGWDGTINGKPAPLGTYIHHTELTDDMGITFIKSGEIILIR
ncbi:MAG: gliding motility-associated C-terminal domain-containing protein [Cytophagales bacterium]|nr:gliding motility-associated C-terminal domain-containing protein [Cytophagales bacterium]